jgi:hypothetical protein
LVNAQIIVDVWQRDPFLHIIIVTVQKFSQLRKQNLFGFQVE